MNKVNFNELGFVNLRKELDKDLILNFNVKGQNIEVKTTIPTKDKIELVSLIINLTVDEDLGFYNPYKLKLISAVEGFIYYSNVEFDENKYENIYEIYDILEDEGFVDVLYSQTDFKQLFLLIEDCVKSVVKYNNSTMGVLTKMRQEPTDMNNQIQEIMNIIHNDPELKEFVNNVLPNLQG